jgi:hypothetical protein
VSQSTRASARPPPRNPTAPCPYLGHVSISLERCGDDAVGQGDRDRGYMEENRAKGKLVVVVDWPHLAPSAHHHRQVPSVSSSARAASSLGAALIALTTNLRTAGCLTCSAFRCARSSSVGKRNSTVMAKAS